MSAPTLRRDVPASKVVQLTNERCACCGAMALQLIRGYMPACAMCVELDKAVANFSPFLVEQYVRALFGAA